MDNPNVILGKPNPNPPIDHGLAPLGPFFFDPLERGAYDVICADPPWKFQHRSAKGVTQKSAGHHYRVESIADIKAKPVIELANPKGALLLMWATAPMLPQQIGVMDHWGFRFTSMLTWRKVGKPRELYMKRGKPVEVPGKVQWGTGYRVRDGAEYVLIGTHGHVPRCTNVLSIFDGQVRRASKGEESGHSRKPVEFWNHVQNLHPKAERWCELFSRESTTLPNGITVEPWGNEVGKFDEAA